MYEIAGRIGIGIKFDGDEFPLQYVNMLDFIHISCSTRIAIPMLHMRVVDTIDWFASRSSLADGALISITLSKGEQDSLETYLFRLNSFSSTKVSTGTSYEIDGYLDVPKYWHGSSSTAVTGTSSAVLKQIALDCDLLFEGDTTADPQTWYPRNRQNHAWCADIYERGYVDTSSCMQLGIDTSGIMVYRNISQMGAIKKNISLSEAKEGAVLATDFKPRMSSGATNHYSGYGEYRIQQTPLGTTKYTAHKQVEFNKDEEGDLTVNKQVKSVVDQSRVTFSYIDPGNNHEEYERAFYQNRRVANLFSSGLDVVIPEVTGLKLLDTVSVITDTARSFLRIYSGAYRIVTRTIYVVGANYYEKLELSRRTLNATLKDAQTTADSGELSQDVTP